MKGTKSFDGLDDILFDTKDSQVGYDESYPMAIDNRILRLYERILPRNARDVLRFFYEGCVRFLLNLFGFGARKADPGTFAFLGLHYLYIVLLIIASSVLIHFGKEIEYIDALFLAASGCSQTGLNTVDLNILSQYQQAVLLVFIFFTSQIFVQIIIVSTKVTWYKQKLDYIVREGRQQIQFKKSISRAKSQTRQFPHDRRGVSKKDIRVLLNHVHSFRKKAEPVDENQNYEFENLSRTSEDNGHQMPADEVGPSSSGPDLELQNRDAELRAMVNGRPIENDEQRPLENTGIAFSELPIPEHNFDENHRKKMFDRIKTTANTLPQERLKSLQGRKSRASSFSNDPGESEANKSGLHRRGRRPSNIFTRDTHSSLALPRETEYLSYAPTVTRNSKFVSLTPEQRRELGGIEYRAHVILLRILILFYVGFFLSGVVGFLIFINIAKTSQKLLEGEGLNRTLWGFFTPLSLFVNNGLALSSTSFIDFQRSVYVLLAGTCLIIIGNTGFSIILRMIIWFSWRLTPRSSPSNDPLMFLLDHPRRCFALLFPKKATIKLLGILVLLISIDVILFNILDLQNQEVTAIPVGYRIVVSFFQAASTRTAGLAAVNLGRVAVSLQASILIMMYIAVYPTAIIIRSTNVYEERALGIFNEDTPQKSLVDQHIKLQLSFDIYFIFLAFFFISIVENNRLKDENDYYFSIWAVLFEVVSAYSTVGFSLGYPQISSSLSGEFRKLSKLIIILCMVRGRHRGLPLGIDKAVMLPKYEYKKEEGAPHNIGRRMSTVDREHER